MGVDLMVFRLTAVSVLLTLSLMSDLKTYKIKNSVTYNFMLIGLATNFAKGGAEGLIFSLQGVMLPVIGLFALYSMGFIGAGDVKLLSAVGSITGPGFAFYSTACSFICGGFIALSLILAGKSGVERLKCLILYIKGCFLSRSLLSYGGFGDRPEKGRFRFSIAIASGTAVVFILHLLGLAGA